jgi:hypothetical protein
VPPDGALPVNGEGTLPVSTLWLLPIVLLLIEGVTATAIASLVSLHPPELTSLLYHVLMASAAGW